MTKAQYGRDDCADEGRFQDGLSRGCRLMHDPIGQVDDESAGLLQHLATVSWRDARRVGAVGVTHGHGAALRWYWRSPPNGRRQAPPNRTAPRAVPGPVPVDSAISRDGAPGHLPPVT